MLRSGPIPRFLHGIIEYIAAIAFLFAPFVLDFDSDAATYLAIAVGVVVLVVAATTDGPTSLVNQIPLPFHILLDYVLAIFLVATPFIFGFSDEGRPTAWFIALGVIHLLVTIATRFYHDPADAIDPSTRPNAPFEDVL
jgi:hypothetical protein